jgi:aldehyde dehydrogenase (NAD+)
LKEYQLYINGDFVPATGNETFPGINPYNQETIATYGRSGARDIDKAVGAARAAFDTGPWPRMSREERGALVKTLAEKISERAKDLVALEVMDSGSTVRKAKEDIYLSSRNLANFARLGLQELDEQLAGVSKPGFSKNLLLREPIGVVAALIPWNFPLKMAIWKIGPALVTGNTIVLKPSEETSATAMELAALAHQTGFPRGVINIVTGTGSEAGQHLVRHRGTDKIAFTGSTAVGRAIMSACSETLKKITLECGGKSANIILDDADLHMAVDGALYAIFYHQGQCCEAGSRLFVPDAIADTLIDELVRKAKMLKTGDPMDPATDIGPLISKKQQQRVLGYIDKGVNDGAHLLAGGGQPSGATTRAGFFVEPTIFDRVDNASTIAQEEIFGPVLSIIRYGKVEEAIRMANESVYGLAGGVWSRDGEKAMRVARQLRAGTVWINEWHLLNERAPFGGYKQSGIGREFGIDGLKEFTEAKHIHIDEVGIREKKTWYDTVVPRS